MTKVALALGSFIVGACSMFLALSGSHTSTLAQSAPTERGVTIVGAEPTVPPLGAPVVGLRMSERIQPVDGLDCIRCAFNNVTLEYGGGAFKFTEFSFSGPVRVNFKGSAANMLVFLQLLSALGAGTRPQTPTPRSPIQKTATTKHTVTVSLSSPYSGE